MPEDEFEGYPFDLIPFPKRNAYSPKPTRPLHGPLTAHFWSKRLCDPMLQVSSRSRVRLLPMRTPGSRRLIRGTMNWPWRTDGFVAQGLHKESRHRRTFSSSGVRRLDSSDFYVMSWYEDKVMLVSAEVSLLCWSVPEVSLTCWSVPEVSCGQSIARPDGNLSLQSVRLHRDGTLSEGELPPKRPTFSG